MAIKEPSLKFQPLLGSPQPSYRSSAVARMARMPVSTLRIWEQRYQAVGPSTAPSGHRLYSTADVQRVMLLRQLTGHGHAIGSLAGLDIEQLRNLSHTHATALPRAHDNLPQHRAPLRIVVVGRAMARRLERACVFNRPARPPEVAAVFDSLADAARAAAGSDGMRIDLLLWQASGLQADALPELKAAQKAWRARDVAVTYRFAGAASRDALVSAGVTVVHEPSENAALVAWLSSLGPVLVEGADGGRKVESTRGINTWSFDALDMSEGEVPARRFDDAALTEFASLSSNIACECPSHVAELLMQISGFESYSAGCSSRTPDDADLHTYLQRVAGAARILFEAALERVATSEGLPLP